LICICLSFFHFVKKFWCTLVRVKVALSKASRRGGGIDQHLPQKEPHMKYLENLSLLRPCHRKVWYAGALALLASIGAAPSQAATATTTFAVTATVLSGCTVAATDLAFGNYSGTAPVPTDATNTVTAICSDGITYTLAGGAGAGVGATVAARKMTGTILGGTLNYLLYADAAHTMLWGDGTLSTVTVGATASLIPQLYTIYGRIPAGQSPAAGLYTDLVTVTLSY
jgi:spore coat protein U-like protein